MTKGKIFLIGLGPGSVDHMTLRAREAIAESDCVIGYSTYIKLVKDLLADKEVIRKGMTEELDRCYEALSRAKAGKQVALISSGDSGVYGMAGPTYEVLLDSGWRPDSDIAVEVIPGASAINSCAALVGAPLTHDACTISLSDLLTPWPVINKRLHAAADSDFVIALYNPKSGRRTQQIVEAQNILLQYRSPQTPVALVKSAYRRRQNIEMTTLDVMADCDIGMLTTVIVGNSNTYVDHNIMVTPRGYKSKYTLSSQQASVKTGETSGRSLSMGLDGWKQQAMHWLTGNDSNDPISAADAFSMSVADILEALKAHGAEQESIWQTVDLPSLPAEHCVALLQSWGQINLQTGSDLGVSCTIPANSSDLQVRSNALLFARDQLTLQIHWDRVHSSWLVSCRGKIQGLYLCDQRGRPLLIIKPEHSTDLAKTTLELSLPENTIKTTQNDREIQHYA